MNHLRCRPARRIGLTAVAGAALAAVVLVPSTPALADTSSYVTFDARATGAIYDFRVLVPDVVPLEVPGGFLASSAQSRKAPLAFGTAGLAPIPALTSLGLIVPQNFLGQPVPPEFQDAAKSVDFTKMPNYCQAAFPNSPGTASSSTCGGPSQANPDFGFTVDGLVGRVSAEADPEEEDSAVTRSTSQAASVTLTALAAGLHNVSALASTGLNENNVPEAVSEATIAGFNLLGDTVRINGIHSATNVAYDGTKEGLAGLSSFSIHDASIFGVPILIGPDGFAVQGQSRDSGATKALVEQVNQQLGAENFSMRIFPPTQLTKNGSLASMSSAGIEFSYLSDGVRYEARIGYTYASVSSVPLGVGTNTVSTGTDSGTSVSSGTASGLDAAAAPAQLPSLVPAAAPGQVALPGSVPSVTQAGNVKLLTGLQLASAVRLNTARLEDMYLAFAGLIAVAAVLCRVRSLAALRAFPSSRS